jgi:hypothetical protein
MLTAQTAIWLISSRRKMILLAHLDFEHIEVINAETGQGRASATLMHLDDELFVVYDWEPLDISAAKDAFGTNGFNSELLDEHYELTLSVGAAISEYMQSCAPDKRPEIIYTGHGWGGALALMQTFVVPPAKLITFGQPAVGNAETTGYLRRKVKEKTGPFSYQRYTYHSDPLADTKFADGYQHIGASICVHRLITADYKEVLNPAPLMKFIQRIWTEAAFGYTKRDYYTLMYLTS